MGEAIASKEGSATYSAPFLVASATTRLVLLPSLSLSSRNSFSETHVGSVRLGESNSVSEFPVSMSSTLMA
jgi:hypothetical protein